MTTYFKEEIRPQLMRRTFERSDRRHFQKAFDEARTTALLSRYMIRCAKKASNGASLIVSRPLVDMERDPSRRCSIIDVSCYVGYSKLTRGAVLFAGAFPSFVPVWHEGELSL